MHECPLCGQECDCDGDDLSQSAPDDCRCALADASAELEETENDWAEGKCPECGAVSSELCDCGDSDYCPCGVYLDGEMNERHPKYPQLCTECGEDEALGDNGRITRTAGVPDEFPGDETCDLDDEAIT